MNLLVALFVLATAAVVAGLGVPPTNGNTNFYIDFRCNFKYNPNGSVNSSSLMPLTYVTVEICGSTPGYTIDGSTLAFVVPSTSTGRTCLVRVTEGGATVSQSFTFYPDVDVTWSDAVATLAINVENWNPWCFTNCQGHPNGAEIKLHTNGTIFREYSNKPVSCFGNRYNLNTLPNTAPGHWLNQCGPLDTYNAPFHVCVLRTQPVGVFIGEYDTIAAQTPATCTEPLVYTNSHTGRGWSGGRTSAPLNVSRPWDSDCTDGVCDSGLLIARLQIPSYCWEPTIQATVGVSAYPNIDAGTGFLQFPRTEILLAWQPTPAGPAAGNVRYNSGSDSQFAINSLNVWWVPATSNYLLHAGYDRQPLPHAPRCILPADTQVKAPTSACYNGTCEAQPISSTLYIDMQGHCDKLEGVTVSQPMSLNPGLRTLFPDYQPDCVTDLIGGRLPVCVFNLPRTVVTTEYYTHGTGFNDVRLPGPEINCQVASQRCNAPGGFMKVCPNFDCLVGADGPTELSFLVSYTTDGFHEHGLFYGRGPIATVTGMAPAFPGCFWVPYVPGNVSVTLAEGTCRLNGPSGAGPLDFIGKGCVEHTENVTTCTAPTCVGTNCTLGDCSPTASFGRILSAFDLNYLPDDSQSRVSVALENVDCDPFRFKTHQGAMPRCYCILPIWVRARIVEKAFNFENPTADWGTGAESCHCTDLENCIPDLRQLSNPAVPHPDSDCTLCDFNADLMFDLTGLPLTTLVKLKTADSTVPYPYGNDPLTLLRTRAWEGDRQIAYNVLRSADLPALDGYSDGVINTPENCCHRQRYCVEVIDNWARKELCVECDHKICTPGIFTRDLCLDLSSPCGNNTLLSGNLDVQLYLLGTGPSSNGRGAKVDISSPGYVRTVRNQGGVNATTVCLGPNAKRAVNPSLKRGFEVVRRETELRMRAEHDTSNMSDEELIDFEVRIAREAHVETERGFYYASQQQSVYKVLCLEYNVTLFERTANISQSVDCRPGGLCWARDWINCMCVNSTCVGRAYGTSGINGGSIPSNNTHFTLADWRGYQIRGPRGRWIQNIKTCQWQNIGFINATYYGYGNRDWCFPVLNAHDLTLIVEEGLIAPANVIWPDPRIHPQLNFTIDCYTVRTGSSINFCRVHPHDIFELWAVTSVRGFPAQDPFLTLKFGLPQNIYRRIPGANLAVGSGQDNNTLTWVYGHNYLCQVADPRYEFRLNWGTYAFPDVGVEKTDPFSCSTAIRPWPTSVYWWDQGLNFCATCSIVPFGSNVPIECRYVFVQPGSDDASKHPLGRIIVQAFFP